MGAIRRAMRDIIREMAAANKVVILHGAMPLEVQQWREATERRYLSEVGEGGTAGPLMKQGVAWRTLFNGNGRRLDRIEHYERGCCKSPQDTVDKMASDGVAWLFPAACNWSRKSWRGHGQAVDRVGVVESTNQLLSRALSRTLKRAEVVGEDAERADQAKIRNGARGFAARDDFLDLLDQLRDTITDMDILTTRC